MAGRHQCRYLRAKILVVKRLSENILRLLRPPLDRDLTPHLCQLSQTVEGTAERNRKAHQVLLGLEVADELARRPREDACRCSNAKVGRA